AFSMLSDQLDLDRLFRRTEPDLIAELQEAAGDGPAAELLSGLFGPTRQLYKRLAQYSLFEQHDLYGRLARRPYLWLAACAERLAALAGRTLGREVAPHEILFDAPPVEREVEIHVDIYYPKEDRYRPLSEVSPVVRTLAREQFDDYVKRVRVFAHPRVAPELRRLENLPDLVSRAIDETPGERSP
ncbi:MAG: metal-dependent phosphohydrolase, partial [Planctomycetota bacterium]